MTEAFIIDAVRTPIGRRGGGLSRMHPSDLAAHVISRLVERTRIDPERVDDVMFGCVAQIGSQAWNIGRTAWLSAGFPESVPGVTLDRQCGSSQQAVSFAAQSIMSGVNDLVVAGGVEVMSLVTMNSSGDVGPEHGFRLPYDGDGWKARYGDAEIHQFNSGQLIAEQWNITREDMEELALASHGRAAAARAEGRFDREIVPAADSSEDECIRPDTTLEKMATLQPIREGSRLTAAVSSQIADGAGAMLLASRRAVEQYGLLPRARVHTMVVAGASPVLNLTAPIPSTEKALLRSGLSIDDIDLFECNEAFASVVLAWSRTLGVPLDRTNVNGGSIALGHPLGASGVRLMTTLLNELERRKGRFGLQTMCEGGGLSNTTIIERLD